MNVSTKYYSKPAAEAVEPEFKFAKVMMLKKVKEGPGPQWRRETKQVYCCQRETNEINQYGEVEVQNKPENY